jgi:hypothetical protein
MLYTNDSKDPNNGPYVCVSERVSASDAIIAVGDNEHLLFTRGNFVCVINRSNGHVFFKSGPEDLPGKSVYSLDANTFYKCFLSEYDYSLRYW